MRAYFNLRIVDCENEGRLESFECHSKILLCGKLESNDTRVLKVLLFDFTVISLQRYIVLLSNRAFNVQ